MAEMQCDQTILGVAIMVRIHGGQMMLVVEHYFLGCHLLVLGLALVRCRASNGPYHPGPMKRMSIASFVSLTPTTVSAAAALRNINKQ